MAIPFQIGAQTIQGLNKRLQEKAQERTIDSILGRSRSTTANIDQLLSEATKLKDPQQRTTVIDTLKGRQVRNQETNQQNIVKAVLNSPNPQQALLQADLPIKTKIDLSKFINEQFLTGGLSIPAAEDRQGIIQGVDQQLITDQEPIAEQPETDPELDIFGQEATTGEDTLNLQPQINPIQTKEIIDNTQSSSNPNLSKPAYIQNGKLDLTKASDIDLGRLAQSFPKAVDAEQKRRDRLEKKASTAVKQFNADRDFNFKLAEPFTKDIANIKLNLPEQENLIDLMDKATKDNDLSFYSKDSFANLLPENLQGAFRSGKGKLLDTVTKQFVLSDISKIKGRPNEWIERRINSALPKIGESKIAQQIVITAKKADIGIQRSRVDIYNETVSEFMDTQGIIPFNIEQIVESKMEPIRLEANQKLAYDLQVLDDEERGIEGIREDIRRGKKATFGQVLTKQRAEELKNHFKGDSEKAINWANKHGWRVPDPGQFKRWVQVSG